MKRVHIFYNGRVQGVGFRFTVQRVALDLKLTGWVKNLPDGRVELVAEGEEDILKKLLEQIKNGFMRPYIQKEETRWKQPTGEFDSFEIRFR